MKKATRIKRSPIVVQAIENEGCETIYLVVTSVFIHYEDEEGSSDKKHTVSVDGKLYRKVESSEHQGAVRISTCSPDFSFNEHCFEPIEE